MLNIKSVNKNIRKAINPLFRIGDFKTDSNIYIVRGERFSAD